VDEYRLWVLPAASGTGAPLFTDLDHLLKLRMTRCTPFPSGVMELRYAPASRPA
jgi:hypothetical protein